MNEILAPCILQTIIICSTIIILSVVAVSAFKIYKVEECQKYSSATRKRGNSCWGMYIFLSSIVVLIAVLIFSYAFYTEKKVLDFISLASALVSIILAIITIIYSFVVNGQTAGQIDELTTTAKSLHDVAKKVDEATASYKGTASSLEDNLSLILVRLDRKIEDTKKILGDLTNNSEIQPNFGKEISHKMVENFVQTSSIVGVSAMYACVKSEEYNTPFTLDCIIEDSRYADYSNGYLIAARSAGLLDLSINAQGRIVTVKKCHSALKSHIDNYIKGQVRIKCYIEKIDEYFDENKDK